MLLNSIVMVEDEMVDEPIIDVEDCYMCFVLLECEQAMIMDQQDVLVRDVARKNNHVV